MLAGCTDSVAAPPDGRAAAPSPPPAHAEVPRTTITGADFPDHVVALTWDDGPDATTLELAQMLARARVSATFFVVGEWTSASEEPGRGRGVFETGHVKIPILGDLVRLGHRLGNHTMHHVLLGRADAITIAAELADDDRAIAPHLTNELRMFRAPGGSWSAEAALAIDRALVGPIGWDIDRKDWEGSLYCRSEHPADECESASGALRVRASVTAKRYLDSITSAGHGIVLLHDRVGDVGSRYAVDVAEILVPELARRGFVFVAPVLRFSPLAPRTFEMPRRVHELRADLDGDGNVDLCLEDGIACARSNGAAFEATRTWSSDLPHADALGDLNGDGRADVCAVTGNALSCALSTGSSFTRATVWLADLAGADESTLVLADVSGDGRADACLRRGTEVLCALAP
jgi:peptidoglycan/xylan/chitin deacetylase (PgdA/CDA1 family)